MSVNDKEKSFEPTYSYTVYFIVRKRWEINKTIKVNLACCVQMLLHLIFRRPDGSASLHIPSISFYEQLFFFSSYYFHFYLFSSVSPFFLVKFQTTKTTSTVLCKKREESNECQRRYRAKISQPSFHSTEDGNQTRNRCKITILLDCLSCNDQKTTIRIEIYHDMVISILRIRFYPSCSIILGEQPYMIS